MNRKLKTPIVASKNPNVSLSGEEVEEESDYANTAVCTVDTSATSDKKSPSFTRSFLPIAVSWVIPLVIMALPIHFTSVISDNNAKLAAEHKNLTIQNQELETQKNNLTEQLQKAKWNENSVAQAQKIINAYCPRESQNRECKSCEKGWEKSPSRCYAINNPKKPDLKTWEKAQENCRGKFSDLAAIVDEDEKKFISDHSYNDAQIKGYWIGLRVEDGRWKWIDERNLNDSFWTQPPTKGHCAISVHNKGWESVNCGENNGWICEKEAVSL